MIICNPVAKGRHFASGFRIQRGVIGMDTLGGRQSQITHGFPVGISGSDLGEDAVNFLRDCRKAPRRSLVAELKRQKRFFTGFFVLIIQSYHGAIGITLDADHGMNCQMNGMTQSVQGHADGIDQKGHVINDNLDHTVPRLPAVNFGRGVVDTQAGVPSYSALCKLKVSQGCPVKVVQGSLFQILGGYSVVIGFEKGPCALDLCRWKPFPGKIG